MSSYREITELHQLGPDVGEPKDAKTVSYVHPELELLVMQVIARYPASHITDDGKVCGLAAVAAINVVEHWLLRHGMAVKETHDS